VARTYSLSSLRKHSVTISELIEVLAGDPMDFDLPEGLNNSTRVMFVGFTYAGRLLEIGIEYLFDESEHVFHAMDATRYYREAFGRRYR
jgi:hypothetical protein